MLASSRLAAKQALRSSARLGVNAAVVPVSVTSQSSSKRAASTRSSASSAPASSIASSSRTSSHSKSAYHSSAPNRDEGTSTRQQPEPQVNVRLTPAAAKSVESIQQWLRNAFPSFPFPDDVALQMVTHESWDHGEEAGHNRRLAFLGRRAMKFYMNLFLAQRAALATEGGLSSSHSNDRVDALLQTSMLGDQVGRELKLAEVMRWTPAISDGQLGAKETGLFKIRGVTVEALVGAIYHQHGGQAARLFFNSRILPNLSTFNEAESSEWKEGIAADAKEAERSIQSTYTSQADGRLSGLSTASGRASSTSTSNQGQVETTASSHQASSAESARPSASLRRRSGSLGNTTAFGISDDSTTATGGSAHSTV